jgi:hypothetical protein
MRNQRLRKPIVAGGEKSESLQENWRSRQLRRRDKDRDKMMGLDERAARVEMRLAAARDCRNTGKERLHVEHREMSLHEKKKLIETRMSKEAFRKEETRPPSRQVCEGRCAPLRQSPLHFCACHCHSIEADRDF